MINDQFPMTNGGIGMIPKVFMGWTLGSDVPRKA
jgi:hypothetical protein